MDEKFIDDALTELDIIHDTVSIKCPAECATAIERINGLIAKFEALKNG